MIASERDKWLLASDEDLNAESHLDFHKSSGKGGQKVNKTSSAVRIYHIPSGRTVTCAESRSQTVNRHTAFKKLRMNIALAFRSDNFILPDMKDVPSVSNPSYPLWVARIFDCIESNNGDLKLCAEALGTTRSQLNKFLRRDPVLWREYSMHASMGKTGVTDE